MATLRPTSFWQRLIVNITTRKQAKGVTAVHAGTDYLGNEYYEQLDAGQFHRRIGESDTVFKGRRWYFPKGEDDWDQPIPPEWEAWLRYRRLQQPTEEEINLNLAVAHVKKLNAKKIMELEAAEKKQKLLESGSVDIVDGNQEEKFNIPSPQYSEWPVYDDLESNPGGTARVYRPVRVKQRKEIEAKEHSDEQSYRKTV